MISSNYHNILIRIAIFQKHAKKILVYLFDIQLFSICIAIMSELIGTLNVNIHEIEFIQDFRRQFSF